MRCQPRLLLDQPVRRPKVSLILLDWGVRESFHSLHYLNQQTVPREDYELIWVEFFNREPAGLRQMIAQTGQGRPGVDRWVVLGYPEETIYHKHRLYNVGLLAARGHVCVIADSDAMYTPHFIEKIIAAFEAAPHGVVHLDQVRSDSRRYYPFNYPSFEEVCQTECGNWHGHATAGVLSHWDRLHDANMGACLAARRDDLLAIGGADEHTDYLGYMCGPYEMTFRLCNYHGEGERWLEDEFLYHTWHPNTSGSNCDYHGPQDGRSMSLRALHARASYRIQPYLRSPLMHWRWRSRQPELPRVLEFLAERTETTWHPTTAPPPSNEVYWGLRNKFGFNLFCQRGHWVALPVAEGYYCPRKHAAGRYAEILESDDFFQLERMVERHVGATAPAAQGRLARMMQRLRDEPVGLLPQRLWRNAQRLARRLRGNQAPWASMEMSHR
ncbi:MAG: glycosyltransferase [Gemmataceae bacterium]